MKKRQSADNNELKLAVIQSQIDEITAAMEHVYTDCNNMEYTGPSSLALHEYFTDIADEEHEHLENQLYELTEQRDQLLAEIYDDDSDADSDEDEDIKRDKGRDPPNTHVDGSFQFTLPEQATAKTMSKDVLRTCLICYNDEPMTNMIAARREDTTAAPSTAIASCSHLCCIPCMRQYVVQEVRGHRYPIKCPSTGCGLKVQTLDLQDLMRGCQQDLAILRQLEVEHAVSPEERIYCPHKDCSALLIHDDMDEEELSVGTEGPTSCPECYRMFCPKCLVTGWHEGFTCREFQALPSHLKSSEDSIVLKMSEQEKWKACPTCKMLVERIEGCNHMHCRCQTSFCYKCGRKYASTAPTADNVHGTPSCTCALFDVPEEGIEPRYQGELIPAVGAIANQPGVQQHVVFPHRRARPERGGRLVSRKPCWHSSSILDCPLSNKCWFRHEEDGMF